MVDHQLFNTDKFVELNSQQTVLKTTPADLGLHF